MNIGVKLKRVILPFITFLGMDEEGHYIEVNHGDQAYLFVSSAMAFKAWAEYVRPKIVTGNEDIPYIVEYVPMCDLGPKMLEKAVTLNA